MSFEDAFMWLGDTPPGRLLAQSTAAFALTEATHILCFGILGGAILAFDLAALKVIFRNAPLRETGRALLPVFVASLAGAAVSGILLVAAGPLKYYTNPIFPLKLGTLVLALLVHLAAYPGFSFFPADRQASRLAPILGIASIILWFTVATLGRWIGLI